MMRMKLIILTFGFELKKKNCCKNNHVGSFLCLQVVRDFYGGFLSNDVKRKSYSYMFIEKKFRTNVLILPKVQFDNNAQYYFKLQK